MAASSTARGGLPVRRLLAAVAAAAALLAAAPAGASALPPVKHVFVIWLENESYDSTFGAGSKAPYLARELTSRGQLLSQYHATGHLSLDNYVSVVSGQAPNPQTQSDCNVYSEFVQVGTAADGQAIGQGCVYPKGVLTIADQLEARGMTWKGYMEDMGSPCRHPAPNSQDHTQSAKVGDQYAARHNPFMYFHSVIDRPSCALNDVPLDRLEADLADPARTANFNFITPNLCNDGHDSPCVDGRPGGLETADAWLRKWVPKILAAPAFKRDGMLVVSFDEAGATPPDGDSSACCNEQPGPNTPSPGGPTPGPGGGRIGAVVLSRFVEPGTVNPQPYNHYAFLRTVEDLFGLGHLGYAGQAGLRPFGADVFGRPDGGTSAGSCDRPPAKPPADSHGRIARGGLIAKAAIRRSGSRVRLALRFRHPARLYVRVGRRGRRIGRPRLQPCRTYVLALPGRHGVVKVAASLRRGNERRRIRY